MSDILLLQGTFLGTPHFAGPAFATPLLGGGRRRVPVAPSGGRRRLRRDWTDDIRKLDEEQEAKAEPRVIELSGVATFETMRLEGAGVITKNQKAIDAERAEAELAEIEALGALPWPKAKRPLWLLGEGFASRPDGGWARGRVIEVKRYVVRGEDGVLRQSGEVEVKVEVLTYPLLSRVEDMDEDGWDPIPARRVPSKVRKALSWPSEKGQGA